MAVRIIFNYRLYLGKVFIGCISAKHLDGFDALPSVRSVFEHLLTDCKYTKNADIEEMSVMFFSNGGDEFVKS